eukprot:Hpha_TRINITY_DN16359_c3_g7::TRINITY_DN16359_c3_g7_i1::g.59181::m.59181
MFALALVASAAALPCVEDNIASMLCSPSGPAPNVALCIGGASRTFQNKIVHRSLKENLIDRLGAPVTTFALLKMGDARGDPKKCCSATITATEEGARQACRVIGVSKLKIKRDSYNKPPNCTSYPVYDERTAEQCPTCHVNSTGHQQSLLGQLENRAMCYRMITEHELLHNRTFDWVLFVRPDLTWFDAVVPWCRHALPKRFGDWSFWLPREHAHQQFWKPWVDHYSCKTPPNTKDDVEHFLMKYTELWDYRHSPLTLPVLITRVMGPGFPTHHGFTHTCHYNMKRFSADLVHDMDKDKHCNGATSANVCNAP